MANLLKMIPHILTWEVGLRQSEINLSPEKMFESVRSRGFHNIPGDRGGYTCCGVTFSTFKSYRPEASLKDLRLLQFEQWIEILRSMFWNPCKADQISNQSVAQMLVDWRWVNGSQAVRDAQVVLGLVPDGIVGPKTLAALNGPDSRSVFLRLKNARIRAYNRIVERSPSQKKFLNGWLNRTNSISYE
ncbi:MAG: peptidoglycan domain protein [Muribaculaceae bacterium]|nr:peptidoglycan domain protein [Muribaculaceae bacterium]